MKPGTASLAYAPHRPAGCRGTPRAAAGVCVLLTLVAVHTAVRVEVLNALAGGVLPRAESGKWREQAGTTESAWRRAGARRGGDSSIVTRLLTPAEAGRMNFETGRARANNALRGVVATWGLFQYAVVPLGVAAAGWVAAMAPRKRLGWACLTLSAGCGGLMFWRSYFTSLGW